LVTKKNEVFIGQRVRLTCSTGFVASEAGVKSLVLQCTSTDAGYIFNPTVSSCYKGTELRI